jgi:8-amino-7-oxononanoate synthase
MTLRYIDHFNHLLGDLEQQSLKRTLKICDSASAPVMTIDGQAMLTFCSNDYLGLANHPELAKAISEGLQRFGSGSGASHMISGHHRPHDDLEKALAKTQEAFISEVRALFFSTGYMANLAAITAISSSLGPNQVMSIYSEELNHASLIDGVRLASKQNQAKVQIFPHQDLQALEQLLANDTNEFKLIVTDGVFSMDGDLAQVTKLLKLAHQYDALILVDDAHGFGVLGQHGFGILEQAGIQKSNEAASRIIYIGTLGKAAGISGAFVAGHKTLVEWILQKGRPYIYTTASPPALAHGLLKSLELISDNSYRTALNQNIQYWKKTLRLKKWVLMPSDTAIQPIMIGKTEDALQVAQQLYKKNIWVPAIRPPTVPANTARLRITFSASHNKEQIDQLVQALVEIEDGL